MEYKFTKVEKDRFGEVISTVTIEFTADHISEYVEGVQRFAIASGFHPETVKEYLGEE